MIKKVFFLVLLTSLGANASEEVLLNPTLKKLFKKALKKDAKVKSLDFSSDRKAAIHEIIRDLIPKCQKNNNAVLDISKRHRTFNCKIVEDALGTILMNNDSSDEALKNDKRNKSIDRLHNVGHYAFGTALILGVITRLPIFVGAGVCVDMLLHLPEKSDYGYISEETKSKLIQLKNNIENTSAQ
jgi:5'-3' exonuclease